MDIDEAIVNRFLARLRTDADSDSWFEQIEEKVCEESTRRYNVENFQVVEALAQTEEFYPAFRKSTEYVKMLEALGILTDDDRTDAGSDGGMSQSQTSEVADESFPESTSTSGAYSDDSAGLQTESHIRVLIETLGVGQQGKHMFALYNVRVWKTDQWGKNSSSWNVIRRYSDFYTLNATIMAQVEFTKHTLHVFTARLFSIPSSRMCRSLARGPSTTWTITFWRNAAML